MVNTKAGVRPPKIGGRPDLATPTEDLIQVVFGFFLIAGGATDGWAHNNILSDVQADGFFTPWHALLYSGFAASAAWTVLLAYRRRHLASRWWLNGWPAGYRLGALGVVLFMIAGLADMIWHETFGIEVSIDALLSPSHLLLSIGSALLLTSPLRSWWTAGGGGQRAAIGIVAAALGTTSVSVFLGYGVVFSDISATLPFEGVRNDLGYLTASHGLASYVVTTGIILVPLLFMHRRRATFGVTATLVAFVGLFPMATREFPGQATAGVLTAIGFALLADAILVQLDHIRGVDAPFRLPLAGIVAGALVSIGHLLGLAVFGGIQWPVELWSGTPITAASIGALLGGLAARPVVYPAEFDEAAAAAAGPERSDDKVAAA